jgi:predicted metal-dependent hydrolase
VQLGLFEEPERLTESRSARLGSRDIAYVLKRSLKRRRVLFTVDETGLTLSVPWLTSERRIGVLLQQGERWILRKLQHYEGRRPAARAWRDGARVDFLGEQLELELSRREGRTIARRAGGTLALALPEPDDPRRVREAVVAWYRHHAKPHFGLRVAHFAALLGEPAPRVMLSGAVGRWGSCNAKREVRLSWRLMQAPGHVIDYVVAHEVAHLRVMSHSTRFWWLVQRLHPDYESARAELDSIGAHLMAL